MNFFYFFEKKSERSENWGGEEEIGLEKAWTHGIRERINDK